MELKKRQIKLESIPLESMIRADWNYKDEDVKLQEKLTENIKRVGQIETIVVREVQTKDGVLKYEIVNGNHRLPSFEAAGLTEAMAYNLGKVPDTEAYRIAIELNETRFVSRSVDLSKLLCEIMESSKIEDLLLTMPYNEKEFKELTDISRWDWNGEVPGLQSSPFNHAVKLNPVLCFTEEELAIYNDYLEKLKALQLGSMETQIIKWIAANPLDAPVSEVISEKKPVKSKKKK